VVEVKTEAGYNLVTTEGLVNIFLLIMLYHR